MSCRVITAVAWRNSLVRWTKDFGFVFLSFSFSFFFLSKLRVLRNRMTVIFFMVL